MVSGGQVMARMNFLTEEDRRKIEGGNLLEMFGDQGAGSPVAGL